MKPGKSILIHSATGGVGLAALNICLHYGFEIFVTVGTNEKREFLKKHFSQIPGNFLFDLYCFILMYIFRLSYWKFERYFF